MMSIPSIDAAGTPWWRTTRRRHRARRRRLVRRHRSGGPHRLLDRRHRRPRHQLGGGDGAGAQRRSSAGQLLRQAHELLEGLDHFAASTGCGEDSSMAYLTINRHSGEVGYAVAGHPPPLVLLPNGSEDLAGRGEQRCSGEAGRGPSASLFVDPGRPSCCTPTGSSSVAASRSMSGLSPGGGCPGVWPAG